MKSPKPWYRSQNDTWYVCLSGKQVPLARGKRNRREAEQVFFRLMAEAESPAASAPVAIPTPPKDESPELVVVLDQFLDWAKDNFATYEWYRSFAQLIADKFGAVRVSDLKPIAVTQWLAQHKTWNSTTRNKVIGIFKQALNWACDQGLITDNPLRALKKPPQKRRDRTLSADERKTILDHIPDEPFRDFVIALQETGARPGEIRKVTAADVRLESGIWVLREHKTDKKTHKPRVIYLSETMREITARLMQKHPTGPLFRTVRGTPWTVNAVRLRFARLRKQFPELDGVVAYSFRHTYATEGLVQGVPIATMAELLGHAGTSMIEAHYGHLAKEREYLHQAAAEVARRVNGTTS